MIRAHRIRLNPTDLQSAYLWQCAGVARFTWNWALAAYNMGVPTSYLKLEFNRLRDHEGFAPFVGEVQSYAYQYAFQDLLMAINRYWSFQKAGKLKPPAGFKPRKDGKPFGWPRFKSRHRDTPAFGLANNGGMKFDENQVVILRCPDGPVNMAESLRYEGRVLAGRVSYTGGHWYLSVQVEVADLPQTADRSKSVGIDLGIRYRAATSDGVIYTNPKATANHQRKLARLQRSLARMTRGGANYAKRKAEIAKLHERIGNVRREHAHVLTTELVGEYGLIGVEDLNVKGMVRNRKLAKAISDAGMYQVRQQLEYKAASIGGQVIVVDRWFASSKICSACGEQVAQLSLSVREWVCPVCGAQHERDGNAAINIRNEAVRLAGMA
jgi:putative transposase